jgi:Tfp pilus assembly protein PilE
MRRNSAARPRARRTAGLSAVELTLLISVLAVVLAASAPAFVRALRVSKVAEAPHQLARLSQQAAAYYAAVHSTDAGLRTSCLPAPAGPTPAQPSATPIDVVFGAPGTPGSATWLALDFQPLEPIRYRYSVASSDEGCTTVAHTPRTLVLRAEGDLDGDESLSMFERTLTVSEGELRLDPLLFTRDRIE